MTTPRRRLIRPATSSGPADHSPQVQKLRARLESERIGLARWMSKLRRAFNALDKHQQRIARIERTISKLEGA